MYSPLVKNSLSYQCCFRTMLFQGNEIFMPVQVCTNVWSNKLLFRHCVLPFLSIYFKHWNSQAAKKVWLTHAKKKNSMKLRNARIGNNFRWLQNYPTITVIFGSPHWISILFLMAIPFCTPWLFLQEFHFFL